MKKFFQLPTLLLTFIAATTTLLTSCDDTTGVIGTDIMPGQDQISSSQEVYSVKTRTIVSDSVLANSNECQLGCVIDPETRSKTTCNFLAQFHILEGTSFPDRNKLITDEQGRIKVDSCDIRIFIKSYYGDSLATMKLNVQELDTKKVIKEHVAYYTNLDASQFLTDGVGEKINLSYSVKDLSRPDSLTDGSTYYRSILVRLPADYGLNLIEIYYENPDFYKNSYQFIHNVCPGFYFKVAGGVGSMITAHTTTLDVYFPYRTKDEAGNDTIVDGMQRMAATEEVIQQTTIDNEIPDTLTSLDNPYTYIKSPAGLFTEVELPISDIVAGAHYNDTINSASITFQRYNDEKDNRYNLKSPNDIILIRKSEVYDFFEKNKLVNEKDSYIASYNTTANAYTFNNISKLVTMLRNERDNGAGITPIMNEDERNARYAKWEADNPDWNKIVLVPVKAEYTTNSSIYGTTSKTLLSVRNLLGMNSVRLRGGKDGDVKIKIVYSRFSQ